MLNIITDTFRAAPRSTNSRHRSPETNSDTNRRYPWEGNRWGAPRGTRTQIRRMRGMSDNMLADIGITRADIERMFD